MKVWYEHITPSYKSLLVEWFVLHWINFKTLGDYSSDVELLLLFWMSVTALNDVYATLNDLYDAEWFVLTLNDLYFLEWFEQCWMICTTLNDLYYDERFE